MRPTVFVDTSFLVALLDPKDLLNHGALEFARELDRRKVELLSTDAVLIEFANYFSRGPLRSKAIVWIGRVRGNKEWEIIRLEPALVTLGERRYRKYRDKFWSLTDCISMEVMLQRGLTEVATFDKHFREGGFNLLPP
jgi:predicted nucleic acid-binding protein